MTIKRAMPICRQTSAVRSCLPFGVRPKEPLSASAGWNEVAKKAERHFGVGAMLFRPAWRFFRCYIIQGGFRMGRRGLIHSLEHAIYQMILVAKIMEEELRKEK